MKINSGHTKKLWPLKLQNMNPQSEKLQLLLKMLKFNIAWPTFVSRESKAAFSDAYIRSLGLTNFSSLPRTHTLTHSRPRVHLLSGAVLLLWSTLPKAGFRAADPSQQGWLDLPWLSGSPWPSFSPNTEHNVPSVPFGHRWFFTTLAVDGSGPDAAHTLHYQDIITVGTIVAIYRYHGAVLQPNDTVSPWRNV